MSDLSGDTKYYKQLAKRAQEQHNLLSAQGYREHDEQGVKEQWSTLGPNAIEQCYQVHHETPIAVC